MKRNASTPAFLALALVLLGACNDSDRSPDPRYPADDVILAVAAQSPTMVSLSWSNPATTYAQQPIDLYSEVRRDGVSLATTREFAYADFAVGPGTRHCYRVSVIGLYESLLGGVYSYGWGSAEKCVVTP